mgnify:CR=1 FL=1
MPAVLWADGRTQRADTWQGLLDGVRNLPWNRHMDEGKFRDVMARRAHIRSGLNILAHGSPRSLFVDLARAGVLRIVRDSEERVLRSMLDAG